MRPRQISRARGVGAKPRGTPGLPDTIALRPEPLLQRTIEDQHRQLGIAAQLALHASRARAPDFTSFVSVTHFGDAYGSPRRASIGHTKTLASVEDPV